MEGNYRHILINLLDRDECSAKLANLREITLIFFAAYIETAPLTPNVQPNVDLLRNLLDVVELALDHLQNVNLMQGRKGYGNNLGPYKTPA